MAELIRRELGDRRREDAPYISMSFGVAASEPGTWSDPGGTLQVADDYLYRAKSAGRNRVCSAMGESEAA